MADRSAAPPNGGEGGKSVGFAAGADAPVRTTGGGRRQKRSTIIQLAELVHIKPKEKTTFSSEQMQRGTTFNVNDFDPDLAGEGALTDFERTAACEKASSGLARPDQGPPPAPQHPRGTLAAASTPS